MRIPFACPSCAAAGSADAAAAGKTARCKHCGHRFTIPRPGTAAESADGILLDEAAGGGYAVMEPVLVSTYVPSRGDESTDSGPRRPKRATSGSATRPAGRRASRSAWPQRMAWSAGIVSIAIAAIALLAPGGLLIAACTVILLGCLMILAGFAVGAYGAFSEDVLYGFLYLLIPLYTAYYMVTRWDDLWFWFACMTLGVGIVLLGIEMARLGGVVT